MKKVFLLLAIALLVSGCIKPVSLPGFEDKAAADETAVGDGAAETAQPAEKIDECGEDFDCFAEHLPECEKARIVFGPGGTPLGFSPFIRLSYEIKGTFGERDCLVAFKMEDDTSRFITRDCALKRDYGSQEFEDFLQAKMLDCLKEELEPYIDLFPGPKGEHSTQQVEVEVKVPDTSKLLEGSVSAVEVRDDLGGFLGEEIKVRGDFRQVNPEYAYPSLGLEYEITDLNRYQELIEQQDACYDRNGTDCFIPRNERDHFILAKLPSETTDWLDFSWRIVFSGRLEKVDVETCQCEYYEAAMQHALGYHSLGRRVVEYCESLDFGDPDNLPHCHEGSTEKETIFYLELSENQLE